MTKKTLKLKPGIYSPAELPNDVYHASSLITKSKLDKLNKSPALYDYQRSQPAEETQALKIGKAFHTLVLEPELFQDEFAVAPPVDRRTKAGKEEWAAFQEVNKGKTVLTQNDYDQIAGMREGCQAHDGLSTILDMKGVCEYTIIAKDKPTGLLVACRPDFWIQDADIMFDLKSTEDASQSAFERSAYKYRYHVQAAWYDYVHFLATGRHLKAFIFGAVEKSAPFLAAAYKASEGMLTAGCLDFRSNLDLFAECLSTGEWPGYDQEINVIELPRYVRSDYERRAEEA